MRTILSHLVLHGFVEVHQALGEQAGADGADAEDVLTLGMKWGGGRYENVEESVIGVVHDVDEIGVQQLLGEGFLGMKKGKGPFVAHIVRHDHLVEPLR